MDRSDNPLRIPESLRPDVEQISELTDPFLDHVTRHAAIWSATGTEIVDAVRAQQ